MRIAASVSAVTVLVGAVVAVGTPALAAISSGKSLPLRPLLLTIDAMPAGWTVEHSTASVIGSGCPKPKGVKAVQNASASFAGGGTQVVEQLRVYSPSVQKGYSSVVAALDHCQHEKLGSTTAAITQMSLPPVGNASQAFDATWKHKGKTSNIYEVVIRSGFIIVTLAERAPASPNIAQFDLLDALALHQLGTSSTPAVAPVQTTTTTAATPPPTTTTTTRPPPPPTTTTAPHVTTPVLTQQQQNAVEDAKNYLSAEPGFSQQGLIQQLSGPGGDGFSVADATAAVDSLTVNWNAQAVDAAQNYNSTIGGFSCSGMIQQLSGPGGDGFTVAQATYGATQAGDC